MAKITKKATERDLKKHLKPLSVSLRDQAKNFYMTVGLGISHWSQMEERLVQVVAGLLRISEAKAGLIMYSNISFHAWVEVIEELFALDGTYPKSSALWRNIAKSLRAENDIRVALAHYSISQEDVDPGEELRAIQAYLRPRRFDVRTKSKKWKPLTMMEIMDFIERVGKTHDKLVTLLTLMKKRKSLR